MPYKSLEARRQALLQESPESRAKRLATNKTYREANPEKIAALNAAWRAAHPEYVEYTREWRRANPGYGKEYMQACREGLKGPFTEAAGSDWQARNREFHLQRKRANTNRRRREVFEEALNHYGKVCYCCGESERALLSLDHINGGGNKHRKESGVTHSSTWAKQNGWPAIFRVACHSCNLGAHLNGGTCPHQKG